jgi:hypothetical protein
MIHIPSEFDRFTPEVINQEGVVLAVRYDVNSLLEQVVGADWQQRAKDVVQSAGKLVQRTVEHPTCREANPDLKVGPVPGGVLAETIPAFWQLYRGLFRQLMKSSLHIGEQEMGAYENPTHGLEFVTQTPRGVGEQFERRFEAHVDLRRTAVLPIVVPSDTGEGRLVICSDQSAASVEKIDASATRVAHKVGWLFCFTEGDKQPHYTEELTTFGSQRTVLTLNYPKINETPEHTEIIQRHIEGKNI